MVDILVWMWHDPHLIGSRASKPPRAPAGVRVPDIRPDLLMLNSRRERRLIKAGKIPVPGKRKVDLPPPLAPGTPRFFKPEHVNRLAELFAKHLKVPHRFVCVSDEVTGLADRVYWIQTPPEAMEMRSYRSPEGNRFPSCYCRLWSQSKDAAKILSPAVLLTDIDALPVADCTPLVDRPEKFVGWRPYRDWGRQLRIGGGVYLFEPGANVDVWEDFYTNPGAAMAQARNAGFRGSDQAWLSFKLAHKVAIYSRNAGIYSIRDLGADHQLPKDARLVQMNGPAQFKPWAYRGPGHWVAEHWRGR